MNSRFDIKYALYDAFAHLCVTFCALVICMMVNTTFSIVMRVVYPKLIFIIPIVAGLISFALQVLAHLSIIAKKKQ